MKLTVEMTEVEFVALTKAVKSVAKGHAPVPESGGAIQKVVDFLSGFAAGTPSVEVDADSDDDDIDADSADSDGESNLVPLHPAIAEQLLPEDTALAAQKEQERLRLLHGKDLWIALIELWREGFGVEDAPQPDRVKALQGAANPLVYAYLKSTRGLTDATRTAVYLLDGGDPYATVLQLTLAQIREARLLAENIAQVSSFHAPEFTDLLEYTYEFRTLPTED